MAYMTLESNTIAGVVTQMTDFMHSMIEKMKKVISSHCTALDFDQGFLNKIITIEGLYSLFLR